MDKVAMDDQLEIAPKEIVFSDVYDSQSYMHSRYIRFLYDLLLERDSTINITHKDKTKWEDHVNFVKSEPYRFWEIIHTTDDPDNAIGALYVTHKNEIGIFIKKSEQRKGYGEVALTMMLESYPDEEFTAHINARNIASITLFEKMGFELFSLTYKKPTIQQIVSSEEYDHFPPQTT